MRALILAAGRGSRLQQSEPKPLTPLLGLTLIERIIFSLKQKGIAEAVVVTGYRSSEIIEKLKERETGIKLTFIENPEWEKGNGVSALRAKPILENEDFLLLMGDHLFDPDILEPVSKKNDNDKTAVLIDRDLNSVFDLEDATKIQIKDGVPVDIGKNLENYDAVDCGIFYCTPEIFTALGRTVSEGKYQLTDAIQYLIYKDRLDIRDVTGRFWIDIDTEKSLKYAKQRLLDSLSKTTDGAISRLLNRRISKHITRQLVETDITPNMVSIIAFLLIVLSSVFFALGEWVYLLAGGILVQFSSILDGCDGEIARLRFIGSGYGAFLDSILDRYADSLIIFGLAYGYWIHNEGLLVWALGFFALIGVFVFSYTNARYEAIFESSESRGIPLRRDMRLFIVAIGAIINQILITFLVLSVLTNFEVIRRTVTTRH
ncbi:putative sugar nucleotidyltransferase [Candidatus Methanoperedens nitroreducens]|uniref:Bifunctional IPC transferase and DIPP synthase n=1 Tax=Candidatus Methanoperedens nitratireducens TaxID=1392998 RepID=A0A062VAB5_9EURY|nr:NTP transferase domain-containing protein [Candidatus Methanoperedens nitroreducens]KCZ73418.1 putative sugar nucleotidyltransferase [Candidatus Methanoperedens nitroreducens]MDJ1422627.1 NTP transferase domain-containing protein [Candidatus Methanoperedens sp.]